MPHRQKPKQNRSNVGTNSIKAFKKWSTLKIIFKKKEESKGAKQITDILKNAEAPKNQDKGRYPGRAQRIPWRRSYPQSTSHFCPETEWQVRTMLHSFQQQKASFHLPVPTLATLMPRFVVIVRH